MPLIRVKLKTKASRQKSYTDFYRREVVFQEGDMVLLEVSPVKGVIWFRMRGKLATRYIRPCKVLQRVEYVSYKLALPLEMERIHSVFHVSMLRKHVLDPNKVISKPNIEISEDLFYVNQLVQIVDTQIRKLRNKEIPKVKVL
ncbi:uncharacterized protein LOC131180667 [Hevea brasiliensis]|uniref:uncharacterized protein LOC131180667 n=1 Tax=Hevea brasiliensis TaxID=3981 RepID=UPI0025F84219|nr:uncharacterized protein LOC131180667 [Hevea brasiliensis]